VRASIRYYSGYSENGGVVGRMGRERGREREQFIDNQEGSKEKC
jgi:hypothetical protein